MQAAGSFVITSIVIVVNIKLLISSFEVTSWIVLLIVLSIAFYMGTFWFFTWYSAEADDFGVFYELFTFSMAYVLLFFFMSSYVLVDSGMRYASMEINAILERRKERAEYEAMLKKRSLKGITVQRKITTKNLGKLVFLGFNDWVCFF